MLIDNKFELEIPTHIAFTLYKNDYVDNLIISKVKKECKNESKRKNEFIISLESFQNAIQTSTFLRAELKKTIGQDLLPNPNFKPNSIFFLQSIINRLPNLNKITFKISDEKIFSRLVKVDGGREIVSFHFNIIEGMFDLTKVLDRVQLDNFNKRFMDVGIMKNKYLERTPYFYIKATVLFDVLSEMEESQGLDTFEIVSSVDPKLEEDDPVLLIKTDYTPY
tara:strand:- start:13 stop:678 length:666 start_codon:yes stop_codon:yes gene_type:complete